MRIDNRLRCVVFVLVAAACAHHSPVGAAEPPARTNAEIFREALAVWERGNIADGDKFITADYRGHTSSGDRDRAGVQKRIESFRAKYSNIQFQIMDQVASGDRVASRLEATAKEVATGQSVRIRAATSLTSIKSRSSVTTHPSRSGLTR